MVGNNKLVQQGRMHPSILGSCACTSIAVSLHEHSCQPARALLLHEHSCQPARALLSACTSIPVSLHKHCCQPAQALLSACTSIAVSLHEHCCQPARALLSACTSIAVSLHKHCCQPQTGYAAWRPVQVAAGATQQTWVMVCHPALENCLSLEHSSDETLLQKPETLSAVHVCRLPTHTHTNHSSGHRPCSAFASLVRLPPTPVFATAASKDRVWGSVQCPQSPSHHHPRHWPISPTHTVFYVIARSNICKACSHRHPCCRFSSSHLTCMRAVCIHMLPQQLDLHDGVILVRLADEDSSPTRATEAIRSADSFGAAADGGAAPGGVGAADSVAAASSKASAGINAKPAIVDKLRSLLVALDPESGECGGTGKKTFAKKTGISVVGQAREAFAGKKPWPWRCLGGRWDCGGLGKRNSKSAPGPGGCYLGVLTWNERGGKGKGRVSLESFFAGFVAGKSPWPWQCMQCHGGACSAMVVHAVPWWCMQCHGDACSAMAVHAVPWRCMQWNVVQAEHGHMQDVSARRTWAQAGRERKEDMGTGRVWAHAGHGRGQA
eukprot:365662-Chlamydomonas_euryale.AAC.7